MKRTPRILVVLSILLICTLACTMPWNETPQEFPATPDATMTELYALATILTPAVTQDTATPNAADTETVSPTETEEIIDTATVTETATQTTTATITPLPTFTQHVPPEGPEEFASVIEAEYLSDAPDIDGVWDEWDTEQYSANAVVYGLNKWDGGDDLKASFRVGWDEDRLYISVKVHDDKYVQNATEANLYKGDSIELLLDTDLHDDYNAHRLNTDDFQLGISPGQDDPGDDMEAYLWFPTGKAGTKSKVKIAAIGDDDLYRVEFSVPWSMFDISPSEGDEFGFAVSVSDNDNSSDDVQQSMVSSAPNRILTDPATWGVLKLVD